LSSIRHSTHAESIFLYALDLIELSGDDLRRDPLEVRKAALASIVAKAQPGIRFNKHIEGDAPAVFAHACKLGLARPQRHTSHVSFPPMSATQNSAVETGTTRPICKGYMYL